MTLALVPIVPSSPIFYHQCLDNVLVGCLFSLMPSISSLTFQRSKHIIFVINIKCLLLARFRTFCISENMTAPVRFETADIQTLRLQINRFLETNYQIEHATVQFEHGTCC